MKRQREFKILLCNPSGGKLLLKQSCIYNLAKHQRRCSSAKTANRLDTLTTSAKNPQHRPPTGLQICVQPEVL